MNMRTTKFSRTLKTGMAAAIFTLSSISASAQNPQPVQTPEAHYRVYDGTGKQAGLREIIEAANRADVVFVGEMHNDPLAHMLEAELLRDAFQHLEETGKPSRRKVALSLEMFERDVQIVLDEYLAGLITEKHFLSGSRPWNNYETDYRPLVEFAREHQLATIAANAPARYVTRVSRSGVESLTALSPTARTWLPPLPFAPASPNYADKFMQFMTGETTRPQQTPNPHDLKGAPPTSNTSPPPPADAHGVQTAHATSHLLDAQNLRDATMAYAIAEHLKHQSGALILHVNGRFHSEERLGVPEHLLRLRPKTRLVVVTIVSGQSFPDFDSSTMARLGDFVIVTDPGFPRSF